MNDSKNWDSLRSGNRNALKALYEDHIDSLYAYGSSITENKVTLEDAIHSLFLRFWNRREALSTPQNVKSYMLICLRNEIYKGFKESKTVGISEENPKDTVSSHEEDIIHGEEKEDNKQRLALALKSLSSRQREIIQLRFVENISYQEIADMLDINYQSVRNIVHRAITKMRKKMKNSP